MGKLTNPEELLRQCIKATWPEILTFTNVKWDNMHNTDKDEIATITPEGLLEQELQNMVHRIARLRDEQERATAKIKEFECAAIKLKKALACLNAEVPLTDKQRRHLEIFPADKFENGVLVVAPDTDEEAAESVMQYSKGLVEAQRAACEDYDRQMRDPKYAAQLKANREVERQARLPADHPEKMFYSNNNWDFR